MDVIFTETCSENKELEIVIQCFSASQNSTFPEKGIATFQHTQANKGKFQESREISSSGKTRARMKGARIRKLFKLVKQKY